MHLEFFVKGESNKETILLVHGNVTPAYSLGHNANDNVVLNKELKLA